MGSRCVRRHRPTSPFVLSLDKARHEKLIQLRVSSSSDTLQMGPLVVAQPSLRRAPATDLDGLVPYCQYVLGGIPYASALWRSVSLLCALLLVPTIRFTLCVMLSIATMRLPLCALQYL